MEVQMKAFCMSELEKWIAGLPNYEAVAPTITCLYYN